MDVNVFAIRNSKGIGNAFTSFVHFVCFKTTQLLLQLS